MNTRSNVNNGVENAKKSNTLKKILQRILWE